MTTTQKPRDIFTSALEERKSDDPLKKRQACEKGYLAAIEAVDDFLASKGTFIPKGDPQAHSKRREALDELAIQDPSMNDLRNKMSIIVDNLHGQCFYAGIDSPMHDQDLKKTVREILEITGHYEDSNEL